MTDEELQKAIQAVSNSIDNLPKADKPLSKEERQHREVLLSRMEALERIKEAKASGLRDEETYNSVLYSLLTSWGEKHSHLMRIVMTNLRWGGGL